MLEVNFLGRSHSKNVEDFLQKNVLFSETFPANQVKLQTEYL